MDREHDEQRRLAENERKRMTTKIYGHDAVLMSSIFRQLSLLEVENRLEDLKDAFANYVDHHNKIVASVKPASRAEQEKCFLQVERVYTKVFQGYNRRMDALRCEMYVRVLPLEPTYPTTTTTSATIEPQPSTSSGIVYVHTCAPISSAATAGAVFAHRLEPVPSTTASAAQITSRQVSAALVAALPVPAAQQAVVASPAIAVLRAAPPRAEGNVAQPTPPRAVGSRSRSPQRAGNDIIRPRNDLRHRLENGIRRVQRVPRVQNGTPPPRVLSCNYCQGPHPLYVCPMFLSLSVTVRRGEVAELELCENCLQPNHTVNECRRGPCRRCTKIAYHNSVLCESTFY